MTYRENVLRAWRRQRPQWIPIVAGIPYLDWASFGYDKAELEAVCKKHEILFPDYATGTLDENHKRVPQFFPDLVAGPPYTDAWGCVWKTVYTGMIGSVIYHPLADWAAFNGFTAPDPDVSDGLRPINWPELTSAAKITRANGTLFACGLPHGHTFLRAQDLRGYENLILDMCDGEPLLDSLLDMIAEFNLTLVKRFIALKPDYISIPEDLGMQNSPMLMPENFGRYIAPRYDTVTRPIKEAGILVHEHSDGFILPLLDDIIKTGGDVINLQDLVNGIDEIAKAAKGRISIDLDIDRQNITVFGTPGDIDAHIKECVMKLGSKEGGLSLCYQPWPMTPPQNMDAAFTAMEKYCVKQYPF